MPRAIRPEIVKHLMAFTKPATDALGFTGKRGHAIRRGNFNQLIEWTKTAKAMGVTGLHFHDLRHTGNTLAAQAGVSTKDLMARMDHGDMRPALIYQRATSDADQRIADKLSDLVDEHRAKGKKKPKKRRKDDDGDSSAGVPVPIG